MSMRFLAVPLIVGGALVAPLAHAGDAATAEALFRQGRSLMEAGNYQGACPKLKESFAQDPATGTLLALGICEEHVGRIASAWATYAEVVTRAKKDGRADREQAARDHMAGLEPKLSRLTIEVDGVASAVPGFTVKRDGRPVGQGAWGTPVPLDPGDHLIEATAPGKKPFQSKITIGAVADAQTVKVPALEDEVAVPGPALAPAAADGAPTGDRGTGSGFSLRTAGLVVGGAGLVTLGVSGFFAIRAKSLVSDSNADGHCDSQNRCDPDGGSKRDDAKSAANVATATVLVGAALAAAGVTLFIVGAPKKQEAAAWIRATPAFGPHESAMLVEGRF